MSHYRRRRVLLVLLFLLISSIPLSTAPLKLPSVATIVGGEIDASEIPTLQDVAVKGRAPKTGYERSEFGGGWENGVDGCDTRNAILLRDLKNTTVDEQCRVISGVLNDPYTGETVMFARGLETSDDVQIDHVVALSNAWQTGAQQLTYEQRVAFANDPLNLLAVKGSANEQKSDGDAATWLPANKTFRCSYVNRQLSVKKKYELWLTASERDAIARILTNCL